MILSELFSRRRGVLDPQATNGVSPISDDLAVSEAARRRQRLLLAGVAGTGLIASSFWIFGDDEKMTDPTQEAADVEVSTKGLVNRNLSQQEWMALSENRFQSAENQLKSVDGQQQRLEELAAQVQALQGQNQSMQNDGQRVLSAYQAENDQLRQQISSKQMAEKREGIHEEIRGMIGEPHLVDVHKQEQMSAADVAAAYHPRGNGRLPAGPPQAGPDVAAKMIAEGRTSLDEARGAAKGTRSLDLHSGLNVQSQANKGLDHGFFQNPNLRK